MDTFIPLKLYFERLKRQKVLFLSCMRTYTLVQYLAPRDPSTTESPEQTMSSSQYPGYGPKHPQLCFEKWEITQRTKAELIMYLLRPYHHKFPEHFIRRSPHWEPQPTPLAGSNIWAGLGVTSSPKSTSKDQNQTHKPLS